jgi:hypothetical protein
MKRQGANPFDGQLEIALMVGAVGSELAMFCRKTSLLIGKNLHATAKKI